MTEVFTFNTNSNKTVNKATKKNEHIYMEDNNKLQLNLFWVPMAIFHESNLQ